MNRSRSLRNTILLIVKYIFYRINLNPAFLYMIFRHARVLREIFSVPSGMVETPRLEAK
jgi:hypothetical protein